MDRVPCYLNPATGRAVKPHTKLGQRLARQGVPQTLCPYNEATGRLRKPAGAPRVPRPRPPRRVPVVHPAVIPAAAPIRPAAAPIRPVAPVAMGPPRRPAGSAPGKWYTIPELKAYCDRRNRAKAKNKAARLLALSQASAHQPPAHVGVPLSELEAYEQNITHLSMDQLQSAEAALQAEIDSLTEQKTEYHNIAEEAIVGVVADQEEKLEEAIIDQAPIEEIEEIKEDLHVAVIQEETLVNKTMKDLFTAQRMMYTCEQRAQIQDDDDVVEDAAATIIAIEDHDWAGAQDLLTKRWNRIQDVRDQEEEKAFVLEDNAPPARTPPPMLAITAVTPEEVKEQLEEYKEELIQSGSPMPSILDKDIGGFEDMAQEIVEEQIGSANPGLSAMDIAHDAQEIVAALDGDEVALVIAGSIKDQINQEVIHDVWDPHEQELADEIESMVLDDMGIQHTPPMLPIAVPPNPFQAPAAGTPNPFQDERRRRRKFGAVLLNKLILAMIARHGFQSIQTPQHIIKKLKSKGYNLTMSQQREVELYYRKHIGLFPGDKRIFPSRKIIKQTIQANLDAGISNSATSYYKMLQKSKYWRANRQVFDVIKDLVAELDPKRPRRKRKPKVTFQLPKLPIGAITGTAAVQAHHLAPPHRVLRPIQRPPRAISPTAPMQSQLSISLPSSQQQDISDDPEGGSSDDEILFPEMSNQVPLGQTQGQGFRGRRRRRVRRRARARIDELYE
jgi:hypothetical protein